MKKKETIEDKLTTLLLLQLLDQKRLYISFYEEQYKFYNKLYYDMLKDEPMKIFFNKHKRWEEKRSELFRKISSTEEKKMELYQDLERTLDAVYGTKKEPSN